MFPVQHVPICGDDRRAAGQGARAEVLGGFRFAQPTPTGPGFGAHRKTPGPKARRSLVGASPPTVTFQRGTAGCTPVATWEELQTGCLQRARTMAPGAASDNARGRMPAMRRGHHYGQLPACCLLGALPSGRCVAHCAVHYLVVFSTASRHCGKTLSDAGRARELPRTSEAPALRLGDQEVAEHLDARDRLEFFRIDKIGIERERVGFAE